MFFFCQRKQKDVAKENEFYLQLLQQALPLEQQTSTTMQPIQQVQSQTHITASLEQHVKTQSNKLNSQCNPSPEKSRGSLYLFSTFTIVHLSGNAKKKISDNLTLECIVGNNNNSVETGVQNGNLHIGSQITPQNQNVTTKNNHRKSLDKGEKQEEQHNKHNVTNVSQSEKNDKRFIHTNGNTIAQSDIQFIERIG